MGRSAGVVLTSGSLVLATLAACQFAEPPLQPESGPGGAEASHAGMTQSAHGEGDTGYWLFEPSGPTPETAPLVIFNHGWSAMKPTGYLIWIEHIVRRGNIVLYPRYQADLLTPPGKFLPNAVAAAKDGIAMLESEGHVHADLEKVALVGHSAGGMITANMGAVAGEVGLPVPKAVMCVEPWAPTNRSGEDILYADLGKVPKGTLLLAIAGEVDQVVGVGGAKKIYRETTQIPAEDKDYVLLVSDDHGRPALVADHFAPAALGNDASSQTLGILSLLRGGPRVGGADALDFYGIWKLFDGLVDAAFYGTDREYALGNTQEQRYMGEWSDGVPVRELVVTDSP